MPIGAWHPLLPTALASLSTQQVAVELAVLDASGDPRVTDAVKSAKIRPAYHRSGPDAGQAQAIDEGWQKTRSPFITWLNADDVLLPGALDTLVQTLTTQTADVAFGNSSILDDDGATIGFHNQVADVDANLSRSNCISQPSALFRRASVEAIGGLDTELQYTMDWDLWLRLYNNGAQFVRLPGTFSGVYWGTGTKTASLGPRRLKEMLRLTARSAGVLNAAKTAISAALQTSTLTGRVTPRGTGIFSSADFNPRESGRTELIVPVLNTHAQAGSVVHLEWDGATPEILPTESDGTVQVDKGSAKILLGTPVPQAGQCTIKLIAPAHYWVRIRRAYFESSTDRSSE
jgi:glycosyl transferase family 2